MRGKRDQVAISPSQGATSEAGPDHRAFAIPPSDPSAYPSQRLDIGVDADRLAGNVSARWGQ
jgi:hypothetical protein